MEKTVALLFKNSYIAFVSAMQRRKQNGATQMRNYISAIREVVPNFKHAGMYSDLIRNGHKVKYLWSRPELTVEQMETIRDKLTEKGYDVQHISDEIGRGLVIKVANE